MADTKRRARGEDSIFFAPSRKCWVGEITVGWKPDGRRDRITVRGKTKTDVKNKLRAKHQELDASVRTPAHYTVQQCIEDWLNSLTTQSPTTLTNYRTAADHVIELTGNIKLADLKARDVQAALTRLATQKSTRTGPEAGSRPGEGGHGVGGEQPRVLQKHRQPANRPRRLAAIQAYHREGGPRH
jgi:hypothetical protein